MRQLQLGLGLTLASGGFSPAGLSGLVLWLDASAGVTLVSSKVSAWADQSGLGNNFAQATSANQPNYSASGFGTNSKPYLSGAGGVSIQYLSCVNASNTILGLSGSERFLVKRELASPPASGDGSTEVTFGVGGQTGHIPYIDGNIYDAFGSSVRKAFAAGIDVSQPFVYSSYSQANDWKAYLNGTQVFATASNGYFADTGKASICGTAGSNSGGQFAEWIIYNRVLSSSERSQIVTYLKQKYGIS